MSGSCVTLLTGSGLISSLTGSGLISSLTSSGLISSLTSSGLITSLTSSGLISSLTGSGLITCTVGLVSGVLLTTTSVFFLKTWRSLGTLSMLPLVTTKLRNNTKKILIIQLLYIYI